MNGQDPWLELHNVDAWLSNAKFFQSLSLKLFTKENTLIMGPNGAGKSSLTKLISRNLYPVIKADSYIKLFGSTNFNLWDVRNKIGFVSTDIESRISKRTKVNDVITAGLFGRFNIDDFKVKLNLDSIYKIEAVRQTLNLDCIRNKSFGEISDGQKKRVVIARSLVHKPKILILDEPIKGLDLKNRFELLDELNELCKNDTTIVIISHMVESIIPNIDRVIFMKQGNIIEDGSKSKLLTSNKLSKLFDTSLNLLTHNGYIQVLPN